MTADQAEREWIEEYAHRIAAHVPSVPVPTILFPCATLDDLGERLAARVRELMPDATVVYKSARLGFNQIEVTKAAPIADEPTIISAAS